MKWEVQDIIESKVNNVTVVKRLRFKKEIKKNYNDIVKSYDLPTFDGNEITLDNAGKKKKISKVKLHVGADKEPIGASYQWQ